MPFSEDLLRYRESGLLPHQAQFIEQFLAPNAAPFQLLVAPPGTGKGGLAAALAVEMAAKNVARRVLVIVPGASTAQFFSQLAAAQMALPVSVIRRPEFREMESRTSAGQPIWPEQIVAIVPIDVAKHIDVKMGLGTVQWDLTIVDEAHRSSGQRAELITYLLEHNSIRRLLAMTATPQPDRLDSLIPNLAVTKWSQRAIVNWDGVPLFQPTRLQTIEYSMSPQDVEFLNALDALVRTMSSDPKGRRAGATLLRRAQSSLFTLDPILLQIQGALIDAEANPPSDASIDADEDEPSDVWAQINWPDRPAAQQQVARLVELLGSLSTDGKLGALVQAVGAWHRDAEEQPFRVCIFCGYADTAVYLSESLRSRLDLPTHCVTGDVAPAERALAANSLRSGSGVLVATDAVLQGIELPSVDYAVNYDLPWNPLRLEVRRTRVDRLERAPPLNFLTLSDRAGEAEILGRLFRKLGELGANDAIWE